MPAEPNPYSSNEVTRIEPPPIRPKATYQAQTHASQDPPFRTFAPSQVSREATAPPQASRFAHNRQMPSASYVETRSYNNPTTSNFQPDWVNYASTHAQRNTPDSWINAPDYVFYQRSSSFYKPPKLELAKFDGNPLNWPLFIQSFKVQVHDAVGSDSERIAHLNNCLAPEVGARLGITLRDPGLYRFALQELQATYGSQIVIAKTCSSILRSLKPVLQGNYAALSKLSATLNSAVVTYQMCGFESELKSYDTVDRVLSCLPELIQERRYYWACNQ